VDCLFEEPMIAFTHKTNKKKGERKKENELALAFFV